MFKGAMPARAIRATPIGDAVFHVCPIFAAPVPHAHDSAVCVRSEPLIFIYYFAGFDITFSFFIIFISPAAIFACINIFVSLHIHFRHFHFRHAVSLRHAITLIFADAMRRFRHHFISPPPLRH
jgi:hypothetical protein